jgi:hypothetical protein
MQVPRDGTTVVAETERLHLLFVAAGIWAFAEILGTTVKVTATRAIIPRDSDFMALF